MWLEAIITKEDFVQVLDDLLPVRIHLDSDEKTERWLRLDRAVEITLVPEEGLRVLCPGELCWSIAGMSPTIKLDELGVLLRPEIVEKNKGHVLDFKFELEDADIRGVPRLLDSTIIHAVNGALAEKRISWNFTETLSHTVKLPNLDPVEALTIQVAWGKRRITEEAVVFAVSFKLGFVRDD